MKFIIATVIVMLATVVFGIFNRRWAIACTFLVLHIALGSFIVGCMSHWASERRHVASAPTTLGEKHASMVKAPEGNRG